MYMLIFGRLSLSTNGCYSNVVPMQFTMCYGHAGVPESLPTPFPLGIERQPADCHRCKGGIPADPIVPQANISTDKGIQTPIRLD